MLSLRHRLSLRRMLAVTTEHGPIRRNKASAGSHTHAAREKLAATGCGDDSPTLAAPTDTIQPTYFYFTPNLYAVFFGSKSASVKPLLVFTFM